MRAALALAAALLLAACAFWSERPLFEPHEAAAPFADGARFTWIPEREQGREEVVYRRVGAEYEIAQIDHADDPPIRALFIAVPSTPEDDYIVQAKLGYSEDTRAIAFMWPIEGGHRFIVAPRALGSISRERLDALCRPQPSGECRFESREQVLAVYEEIIYPLFVASEATPADYIDQIAHPAEAQ